MPISIRSNLAAQSVLRHLQNNNQDVTDSVARLSSGLRVSRAGDDPASSAIASRLRVEIAALEQAIVNANQGVSLLQVADGSLARVQDILVRLRQLASQSGSQNLGDFERQLLDEEFQLLLDEIDRLAAASDFNGRSLFRGQNIPQRDLDQRGAAAIRLKFGIAAEVQGTPFPDPPAALTAGNNAYNFLGERVGSEQVSNLLIRGFDNRGTSFGGDGQFTFQLRAADSSDGFSVTPGATPSALTTTGGVETQSRNFVFSLFGTGQANNQLVFTSRLSDDFLENPGQANVRLRTGTTLQFELAQADRAQRDDGGTTIPALSRETLRNAAFQLTLNDNFQLGTLADNAAATDITGHNSYYSGANLYLNSVNPTVDPTTNPEERESITRFNFRVGSGTRPNEDDVAVGIAGISRVNIGLLGANIRTRGQADAYNTAINFSIDYLSQVRTQVGAARNRLDVSARNVATTVENSEAARSTLVDLDVAREISRFTSLQILVQTGIAVLAQANQLPQNLLRLFT